MAQLGFDADVPGWLLHQVELLLVGLFVCFRAVCARLWYFRISMITRVLFGLLSFKFSIMHTATIVVYLLNISDLSYNLLSYSFPYFLFLLINAQMGLGLGAYERFMLSVLDLKL